MAKTVITNVHIVTEEGILPNTPDTWLMVEDGKIVSIECKAGREVPDSVTVVDGGGGTLVPGSIDLHIHGANGYDMLDGTTRSIEQVSAVLAKTGCTAFLATSVTAPYEDLVSFIKNVHLVRGKEPGASIVGIHLEGPYLNRKRKGMQNEDYLRSPDIEEMKRLLAHADGFVKMVTLAPELPGGDAMVRFLRDEGIVVSIAHSDANYDQAKAAFGMGVSHVTHCFNAMRSIHHRDPGVVVAAWENPTVTCEAIVDNIHLHPAIVRLMHRNLGYDRMALVTDAMQAMGLGDGKYRFGGHVVHVKDGIARLPDGTLASSTVTMTQAIRNAVQDGIDLFDAVQMSSATPARIVGLTRKGAIRPGFDADLVVLDKDLQASWVMVRGKVLAG